MNYSSRHHQPVCHIKKTIFTTILCSTLILSAHTTSAADKNNDLQKVNSLLNGEHNKPYTSFLPKDKIANSLAILPPPPAYNNIAFLADKAAFEEGHSFVNTPRWEEAANDADLSDHNLGHPFSKAVGVDISEKNTPITFNLLRKVLIDAGLNGTDIAKNHYNRERPFVFFHTTTCTPKDEKFLLHDASYPSGHSAFGWASALILSEIEPQKQDAILKRGYDFGQSRVICGAHWQSDVNAGRIIGSEVFARLHTDKSFNEALQKAKDELDQKIKEKKSK